MIVRGVNRIILAVRDLQKAKSYYADLLGAIESTRSTFRNSIHNAQRLLGYTGTSIGWLCVGAALVGVGGLIPRIREYR